MKTTLTLTAICLCLSAPAFAANDGTTDKDMTNEHAKKMAAYVMKKVDANNDGFITKDEQNAYGEQMFTAADTDHDGKLSMDELTAAKTKEIDDMKSAGAAPTSMMVEKHAMKMAKWYMKKADTNHDGFISKDEQQALSDKMFAMTDMNNDGKISVDELTTAKDKEMEEMKAAMKAGTDNTRMEGSKQE